MVGCGTEGGGRGEGPPRTAAAGIAAVVIGLGRQVGVRGEGRKRRRWICIADPEITVPLRALSAQRELVIS